MFITSNMRTTATLQEISPLKPKGFIGAFRTIYPASYRDYSPKQD
jgi:hypothetical protein